MRIIRQYRGMITGVAVRPTFRVGVREGAAGIHGICGEFRGRLRIAAADVSPSAPWAIHGGGLKAAPYMSIVAPTHLCEQHRCDAGAAFASKDGQSRDAAPVARPLAATNNM